MSHFTPIQRVTIDLTRLPTESRRKLKERLGIRDQRPIAYVMQGSSLLDELKQWIKEETKL